MHGPNAQSALLKTLEEPPARTVLILCSEDDERLLPTIRSRCVLIRLGPVASRAIEEILVERGVADAPTAARLGRLSGGRPGAAIELAAAPAAARLRGEIARSLLDLLDATRTARLAGVRDLAARSAEMLRAIQGDQASGSAAGATTARRRSRSAAATAASIGMRGGDGSADAAGTESPGVADGEAQPSEVGGPAARVPPAERRAAVLALVGVWRDVVRDIALVGLAAPAQTRDPELLADLETAGRRLPPGRAGVQLRRLEVAGERLEGNVSPELVLDGLALGWGR